MDWTMDEQVYCAARLYLGGHRAKMTECELEIIVNLIYHYGRKEYKSQCKEICDTVHDYLTQARWERCDRRCSKVENKGGR